MVKYHVYQGPINSREDLEHQITVACRCVTPAIRVWEDLSGNELTHAKEVVDSILNISLTDLFRFYVLFFIKASFSLEFHLFEFL